MSSTLDLPGIHTRPRPRVPAPARFRTDVVGFVAFERRLRPATATNAGPTGGHEVTLDVEQFRCELDTVTCLVAAPGGSLVLSAGPDPLLADGQAVTFAVVAGMRVERRPIDRERGLPVAELVVVGGTPSAALARPPSRADIEADISARTAEGADPAVALPAIRSWRLLAEVTVRADAGALWTTVVPRLGITRCEDWRDFQLRFGEGPDGGMRLAESVRAFFANGGRRCHVATVRRPADTDAVELARSRDEMVGRLDAPAARATGVAALLLGEEVSVVACPDLHARRSRRATVTVRIPAVADAGEFRACGAEPEQPAEVEGEEEGDEPVFDPADVVDTQAELLRAAAGAPLGVQVLLTPPMQRDPSTGRYRSPTADEAVRWRDELVGKPDLDDRARSFGAAYWPWLRSQAAVGAPALDSPPLGAVAGIVARTDLARGPFVAPANAAVDGAVGVSTPVEDRDHVRLHDPGASTGSPRPGSVNVLRPRQNRGVELWGSRTLAEDRWKRHLPVRRGLSALERRVVLAARELVFEPNTPVLWLRITHLLVEVLLPEYERGGLRGGRPEEAFRVRCDETLNTPEDISAGRLHCEVEVALAAPAEFIVFRLGRVDGAIQVVEP